MNETSKSKDIRKKSNVQGYGNLLISTIRTSMLIVGLVKDMVNLEIRRTLERCWTVYKNEDGCVSVI